MLAYMSETAIPVAEAAKDFLKVLDLVERKREPAVLVREGRPVATLSPLPSTVLTCAELAERWGMLDRLSPGEGHEFADDLESGRGSLRPLKPAWD
jgi:antitoxin (DNA-binding transcriptional repressor) of toxin-antitoxin stability system